MPFSITYYSVCWQMKWVDAQATANNCTPHPLTTLVGSFATECGPAELVRSLQLWPDQYFHYFIFLRSSFFVSVKSFMQSPSWIAFLFSCSSWSSTSCEHKLCVCVCICVLYVHVSIIYVCVCECVSMCMCSRVCVWMYIRFEWQFQYQVNIMFTCAASRS